MLAPLCGRGGKDVIPLWRDDQAETPNITSGVISILERTFGTKVSPEALFSYAYALLSTPEYTERFSEALSNPGPRLPVTKDGVLFRRAAEAGQRLIWLHTFGERFVPQGKCPGSVPRGEVRCLRGIPNEPDRYPENFLYREPERVLRVGDGAFSPVSPEIWNFTVSGLQVVKNWLDYRKKGGAGRRSSPLDDIRPECWTAGMTQELLELLWVLEHTLAMAPDLREILERVVQSDCFTEAALPAPSKEEKIPPAR